MPMSATQRPVAPDTEAIWHAFHDGLLRFIRRRVRSPEIAEDILQEVMLRIHRHAAELESASAVGAWVHRIASNAIADHYRNVRVGREVLAGGELDPESALEREAEAPDVRGELAACITPLLKLLPAIYQEALTLTELEDLTQTDAAARVGLSVSGMKSRVQRARRQLKQVLLECCEVELDARGDITGYRPQRRSCSCVGECE
jgi:RNA polymerase sigma-70 factor, ECF subfamily